MIKKITFNKASVLLMYCAIVGIFVFCLITKDYPPTAFIIAWFGFWISQAVITARLEVDKRKKNEKIRFLEAVEPYMNEENATKLIEKYVGIEPKYKKGKK